MLVHHPDPRRDGVARAAELDRLAAEEDLPLVGRVQPEDRVHEGALARPVLAEEAEHLALAEHQADVPVGDDPREALGETSDLQDRLDCLAHRRVLLILPGWWIAPSRGRVVGGPCSAG